MRLLVTILWSIATVMWLPWFAVLVRFVMDLISGTQWNYSEYLNPALIAIWPVRGWLDWQIVSWWPILGVVAMLLTYVGWRFFWWEQDWRPTHRAATVIAGVLVPPLSLILLYRDARRRFAQRNAALQDSVDEAVQALGESETLQLVP